MLLNQKRGCFLLTASFLYLFAVQESLVIFCCLYSIFNSFQNNCSFCWCSFRIVLFTFSFFFSGCIMQIPKTWFLPHKVFFVALQLFCMFSRFLIVCGSFSSMPFLFFCFWNYHFGSLNLVVVFF